MNHDVSLTISSRRLERGIVVAIAGELDVATVPIVAEEVRRAEASEDQFVLDVAGVTFMDSTGLRMIIALDRRLHERGGALRFDHVPRQVGRLFDLVGISSRLALDDRVDGRPERRTTSSSAQASPRWPARRCLLSSRRRAGFTCLSSG